MPCVVTTMQGHDELRLDLDQLGREGARRMLAAALEAEVDAYLAGSTRSQAWSPACPGPASSGARRALAEIRDAPDRDLARRAIEAFARDDGAEWPKAVATITDDARRCCAASTSPPSVGCT
jgi:hypothetical protein